MRSASVGGLTGIRTAESDSLRAGKLGRALKLESASTAHTGRVIVGMNCANKYATPTHKARTTRAYSVSVPV